MTKLVTRFIFGFFMVLTGIMPAQEIDEATLAITNSKIDSLLNVAVQAISASDYDTSINLLEIARSLAKDVQNDKYLGITSHTLSKIYLQSGNLEKARLENKNAITYQEKSKDIEGLAQSYINSSDIAIHTKNYARASKYIEQALVQLKGSYRPDLTAQIRINQGRIAYYQGNPTLSDSLYDKALQQANLAQNTYLAAMAWRHKARSLEAQQKYKQAMLSLEKTQELSKAEGYDELLLASYKQGQDIALAQNDQVTADKYEALHKELTSKLQAQKANIVTTITVDPAQEKLLSQNLTKDITREQQVRAQSKMLAKVLIISMMTLLTLLILSLYKNNKLRAKANELLQAKNTELIIARDNAEKASMVKAQFLSTITHELRTPMYAVTGLTHLLLTENPTPEQKKHLDSLKFSGEYLLSLINNILDLNKLEANKVEVEQTNFSLEKRIKDVLFALEKSARDKGNTLHFEYDKDIPQELLGDPLMISQILINLVGNAVKFTRDGDVHVRVQKIKQNDQTISLHFEVEDTGEGISKKKQKNIFQNFTQGSVAINRKFGGTGLGLSIVKNLLDLLNSKISLESTLGKGSKFSFDIDYNLTQLAPGEENPHNIIYDVDYVALENRKILIVEDNKINQMITRKILEKNKMICDVADNGEIAVEKVSKDHFDLVLMDIHMPGISGLEATERIRGFNKEIPILALTAVTIDENIDRFHQAGLNDIIPKPYKLEEFFQKIHNALKNANTIA